jgi:DNA-binding MarR family transcriptional regulator
MANKKLSFPARHFVAMEFPLSLAQADKELKPTHAQRVLSYLTILHYLGEKSYCKKIREDLDMGSHVSGILGALEEAGWIKRKYEMADGRRVKACYPTSRSERILEKCGSPPYG